jgi:ATPase subunit of ABC transporter with duplicated ATPase domains
VKENRKSRVCARQQQLRRYARDYRDYYEKRAQREKEEKREIQTVTKTKRDVVRCSRAETTTTKINAPVFTSGQNSALVQTQTRGVCE